MKLIFELKMLGKDRLATGVEPFWASKVDRWYQLDEVCFGFCEALHSWNYLTDIPKPDVILICLPEASNLADFEFAQSGAQSPSKFVYTLPNICASLILQILGISGKAFCLNFGSRTQDFAKNEAAEFSKAGKKVWLFSSSAKIEDGCRRFSLEIW